MCFVLNEAGGWKHEVGVRVIIVMIASSDMVVMLLLSRCCVDDPILYLICKQDFLMFQKRIKL